MKKRMLLLLLALTAVICLMAFSVSATSVENTISAECKFCGGVKTWYPITSTSTNLNNDGYTHYYVLDDFQVLGTQTIKKTICVELAGRKLVPNRPITINSGGTLNIQGSGTLVARGNGMTSVAGAAYIKSGGTVNLKDLTVTFEYYETRNVLNGGLFKVEGTLTADNCKMSGGIASEAGGNIYIGTTGVATLTNCKITGGTAPTGHCVYNTGKMTLVGATTIEQLQLNPVSGGPTIDQMLTVKSFTGGGDLMIPKDTPAGTKLATLVNTTLPITTVTLSGAKLQLDVSGGNLVTKLMPAAYINGKAFDEMADALAALTAGQTLVLGRNAGDIVLTKAATLDLDGCNADSITAQGATVYVMDSQTADYDVSDGLYGKVTAISGDVQALPATATQNPYVKITEDDGISFHAVSLNISGMTLKPGEAALYFNNTFNGDQVVKENILSFGVAMSVTGEPTAETMKNSKHYTKLDPSLFGTAEGNTGSLLYGIMKDSNGLNTNTKNAATQVYGKAYIQVGENEYVFGTNRVRSLQEQVKAVDQQYDTMEDWSQKDGILDLFERFTQVMKNWDLPSISLAVENREANTIRIFTIGNSHANDTTWQLYNVFAKQNPNKRIIVGTMYYSGCPMNKHVQYAESNAPEYSYHKNSTGYWVTQKNATLMDGLTDEKWDIVVFQEMNIQAGQAKEFQDDDIARLKAYVENILGYEPTYYWHMVWTNPVTDIYWNEKTRPTALPDTWVERYETLFGTDQMYMYEQMTQNVKDYILTDDTFTGVLASGTAVQYANNVLGMTDLDLYRDYTHTSEFARLMVSYLWYCQLTGDRLETIDDVKVDIIPQHLRHSRFTSQGDMEITDFMKQVIVDAVNYTLENPLEVPNTMQTEDPAEDDSFNVLMIGNSFCTYYTDELVGLAKAAGKQLRLCNVYYGGCPLKNHSNWLRTGEAPYAFYVKDTDGTSTKEEDVSLEYCLSRYNWDIISLQGASQDLMKVETAQECLDANRGYLEHLLGYYRQMFPQTQFAWHHTWAYQVGTTSHSSPITTTLEDQHIYDAKMKEYATAICEEFDLLRINSGEAWRIVRDGGYDKMCARIGKNVAGATPNTGDNYHDGDIGGGQYLNACVWFEHLFGESCVGNTFVPTYTYNGTTFDMLIDIETLQNAAHQAVQEAKSGN